MKKVFPLEGTTPRKASDDEKKKSNLLKLKPVTPVLSRKRRRALFKEEEEAHEQQREPSSSESPTKFSEEQQHALHSIVDEGKNVYVFGNAGTGKSLILQEAVLRLRRLGKKVAVTASTGIAGVAIGGSTLHAFAATFVPKNVGSHTWGYA